MKYTFFTRMSGLHAMPITNITHSACYTVEMDVSAGDLTRIIPDNNHTAYRYLSAGDRLCVCVCQKLLVGNGVTIVINTSVMKIKMVQPSSRPHVSFAIITSNGNQITPAKHQDNLEMKV